MDGYVIDISNLSTYSSVAQNLSIWLLFLIAKVNDLKITKGDIRNVYINTYIEEKVYSKADLEGKGY